MDAHGAGRVSRKRLVVDRNDGSGPGIETRRMDERSYPIHLVVEVDAGGDPIRGTVTDDDGHTSPFVGWVALISALTEGFGTRRPVA